MDPIRRRESVCRRLFGPVDHDQLRRDLGLKLSEAAERDSRRWNFNFQAETPLPGRFEWEEIPAGCAAAFYQECARPRDAALCSSNTEAEAEEEEEEEEGDDRLRDCEGSEGKDQENCSRISNTLKRPAEVTPVRRKRTLSRPAAKPGSNARITDFFAKRRRTSTEAKSILSPLRTSCGEAALCKTIR